MHRIGSVECSARGVVRRVCRRIANSASISSRKPWPTFQNNVGACQDNPFSCGAVGEPTVGHNHVPPLQRRHLCNCHYQHREVKWSKHICCTFKLSASLGDFCQPSGIWNRWRWGIVQYRWVYYFQNIESVYVSRYDPCCLCLYCCVNLLRLGASGAFHRSRWRKYDHSNFRQRQRPDCTRVSVCEKKIKYYIIL